MDFIGIATGIQDVRVLLTNTGPAVILMTINVRITTGAQTMAALKMKSHSLNGSIASLILLQVGKNVVTCLVITPDVKTRGNVRGL